VITVLGRQPSDVSEIGTAESWELRLKGVLRAYVLVAASSSDCGN
jgi:hypothetical protein